MEDSARPDSRYARQLILPGVGPAGQERLSRARVLIAGLGGLGSPASLYLAAAGVGTIGLADPDTVDSTNLHRQILHDAGSVSTAKVESARTRLLRQNPDLNCEVIPGGITARNAVALFKQFDLIVDGTDNFPTRYLINDAAFFAGKPVVYGSIFQFEGQVSVFHPAQGSPCYRCLFPEMPDPASVPNCAEAGVFGALCGIVGSWQASEAIKLIIGIGEPLTGRIKILDTLSGMDQLIALAKDPRCPLCGSHPEITDFRPDRYAFSCDPASEEEPDLEVHPRQALELLQGDDPPLLIDVREPFERGICVLQDDFHIPLGAIQDNWNTLPIDRPILVYCHHGIRSMSATRFLRGMGFRHVRNLQGGIDAWSREVDPAVPRY